MSQSGDDAPRLKVNVLWTLNLLTIFPRLTTMPQAQVLEVAWNHICTKRRTNAPVIPRMAVFGPPGSGKTTLAMHMAEHYGCVHGAC